MVVVPSKCCVSEAYSPLRAALQALSGFAGCQRGRRFSHCPDSAASRTVGWTRMPLLTHDSLWQQPQLLGSAVNLVRGLNDSCGRAELLQRSHNATLTTAGWHRNLMWTPVPKGNQCQERDPSCGEKDSWNNNNGQRTHTLHNNKDAHGGCVDGQTWTKLFHTLAVLDGVFVFTLDQQHTNNCPIKNHAHPAEL